MSKKRLSSVNINTRGQFSYPVVNKRLLLYLPPSPHPLRKIKGKICDIVDKKVILTKKKFLTRFSFATWSTFRCSVMMNDEASPTSSNPNKIWSSSVHDPDSSTDEPETNIFFLMNNYFYDFFENWHNRLFSSLLKHILSHWRDSHTWRQSY